MTALPCRFRRTGRARPAPLAVVWLPGLGSGNNPGRFIVALLAALLLTGCAVRRPVELGPGLERDRALSLFQAGLARQARCPDALDAQVRVAIESTWRSGAVDGYLQAMAPGRIKFFGVNPLGQPALIFSSTGEWFQLISVPEAKGYEGRVDGRTFGKYGPPGFQPEALYYLLIGGIRPGDWQITAVRVAEAGEGYWYDLAREAGTVRTRVRLDPGQQRFSQRQFLDADGEVLASVSYADFVSEVCCLPTGLVVEAAGVTLTLTFDDCRPASGLTAEDFRLDIPVAFSRETVP